MKKIMLIAATAIVAQTATAQTTIAPELGFQMTNVAQKWGGQKASTDMKAGLRLGANADMGITKNIHISAGLFYSGMGAKKGDNTLTLDYLQLPVYVNYMTGAEGGNRFFAGVGPYVGYAMGGKSKEGGKSSNVQFGSEDGDMKRMDMGVNINAGYMLSMGIYARAFYSLGLTNNMSGGNSDNSIKNSGFGLTLGYIFHL